jgi:hypothetical protein
MRVQTGDILRRRLQGDHWLIYDIKEYPNDIYQLQVLNLEKQLWDVYTSPFGLDIPDTFVKVC